MRIEGRIAFITGCNRGLGADLLAALLARGVAKVYAASRTPITHADARVVPVALDITNPAQLQAAVGGAPDVELLVNNAGVMTAFPVLTCEPSALAHDMNVNFHGVVGVMRAFAPTLVANAAKGEAAMVNVLSVAALAPFPMMGGYSASKAAQWSAVQSIRTSLRPSRVHVHAAFPGAIDTDMTRGYDAPKASPADVARHLLDGVEHGVEDIATDGFSHEVLGMFQKDPQAVQRMFASFA